MYIRFCFKTIFDGGYADRKILNGSRNLLILAITKSLVEIYKNNKKAEGYIKAKKAENKDIRIMYSHKKEPAEKVNFGISKKMNKIRRRDFVGASR